MKIKHISIISSLLPVALVILLFFGILSGSSPTTSFDCSGLTQWCFGKAGISLPRTAQAQYDATQCIQFQKPKLEIWSFFIVLMTLENMSLM